MGAVLGLTALPAAFTLSAAVVDKPGSAMVLRITLTILAAAALVACRTTGPQAPGPSDLAVKGAGATFPAPLYQRWFSRLAVREGLLLGYAAVGSLEGEDQLLAGEVDFAGSDRDPLRDRVPPLDGNRWLAIPVTAGAIAVAYNHPGCRLRLSRTQLRHVLEGQVANYSQLGCPAKPLLLVDRSKGSGTEDTVLRYARLAPGSRAGRRGPHVDSNDAMATALSQRAGGLGYLDTVYLHGRAALQSAALQNDSGRYVQPVPAAVQAALRTGGSQGDAYPLTTYSWLLLPRHGLGPKASVLQQAVAYGLSAKGQQQACEL